MQVKIFHKEDILNKLKTRQLYEENFDIGDRDFVDYYYDVIIKRNEVAVLTDGESIISMVHLNPYEYCVFGENHNVHYLVAIATSDKYRRKGYMSILMNEVIEYLKKLKEPFCYLLPKDKCLEKYYSKFGFVNVCKFNIDKFSKEEYDVYPIQSKEYNDLMKEEDKFLSLESNEYKENLSKKVVMVKVLNSDVSFDIERLKSSRMYICQEV